MKVRPGETDPLAGYVPVRIRHPVADRTADALPPPAEVSPSRRCRRRAKPLRFRLPSVAPLLFLLACGVLVFLVGGVAYGFFYEQPLEVTAPELTALARPVDFLARWGRRVRGLSARQREAPARTADAARDVPEERDDAMSVAVNRVVRHGEECASVQEAVDLSTAGMTAEEPAKSAPPDAGHPVGGRLDAGSLRSFRNGGRKGKPLR